MPVLAFPDALAVIAQAFAAVPPPPCAPLSLEEANGRVLGADVHADRDQPPFTRSTRDGFAVRSAGLASGGDAVALQVLGEIAAGQRFAGRVDVGQAVEIMTGAPLPEGADAVVMIEDTDAPRGRAPVAAPRVVSIRRAPRAGENVVSQGSEAAAGAVVLRAGRVLDAATLGLLASVGVAQPPVARRPRVAIVTTGSEIVPVDAQPRATEIRNSNAPALAAAVATAGGEAILFATAPDDPEALREQVAAALQTADLLLVTGGVSAGKHDHVKPVLAALGGQFAIEGVAMRPGKPLVFGEVAGKRFFALPGNPLSVLVTFAAFVRPAIAALAGAGFPGPRTWSATLTDAYQQKPLPLTVFVPVARVSSWPTVRVRPLATQGSGDLAAMAAADGWMVVAPQMDDVPAGAVVTVLTA